MGAESFSFSFPILCLLSAFVACVAFVASLSIKAVRKDRRVVIFDDGKPSRVVGPGVILKWPSARFQVVDLGIQSLPIPEIELLASERYAIVAGTFKFQIVDPLRAAAVKNLRGEIDSALERVLVNVLSNASIQQCLEERFVFEIQILDLVNRKTMSWGVKVSELKISDFPLQRHLIRQIMNIMANVMSGVTQFHIDDGRYLDLATKQKAPVEIIGTINRP